MNFIKLRQPLASLVCSGIVDVVPALADHDFRGRIYVVASDEEVDDKLDNYPYEQVSEILNSVYFGNIPEFDEMPTGAIIGAVDIIDCVQESYSKWDDGTNGMKYRLSNAEQLNKSFPFSPDENWGSLPPCINIKASLHKSGKNTIKLKGDKLTIPVGSSSFKKYNDGQYRAFDFFIDEDVEDCGLFPDLTSYKTTRINSVELVCDKQKALFAVDDIKAGARLDKNGQIIKLPSVYEPEGREWECVMISLGRKLMWI